MVSLPADLQPLIIQAVIIVLSCIILAKIIDRLIRAAEERTKAKKGRFLYAKRFVQLTIYTVAAILLLGTFDIDVTGLVAGLGIGALVIGFAMKDMIENWVSGLLIISARTYRIGDVIVAENLTGVVTDISLRATKMKTYDRNEILIPNSTMLQQKIVNLTSGEKETVASITFYIDYTFDIEKAEKAIEEVLRSHQNVIVDENRRREIRFIVRIKEWTTEIESLFWINEPENEEFIKSKITKLIKKKLEEDNILPPIPAVMRGDFLKGKE